MPRRAAPPSRAGLVKANEQTEKKKFATASPICQRSCGRVSRNNMDSGELEVCRGASFGRQTRDLVGVQLAAMLCLAEAALRLTPGQIHRRIITSMTRSMRGSENQSSCFPAREVFFLII